MKRVIILSDEKQIPKLRPYFSDSVLVATNLTIKKKLQNLGFIPKSIEEYLPLKIKPQFNLDGDFFIQNWILNNAKFNNSLSYKNLHLFDLLRHNLICISSYPSIREIIRMVDALKAIIAKEKPNHIITVDDKHIISKVLKSMTAPTLIKSINFKDYKNELLLPKLANYLIRFNLFKGRYSKKQANLTGKVVIFAAGYNYIAPLLPLIKIMKGDFTIIKPIQLRDDNILKLLKEESLSFTLIENLLDRNLLNVIKYHNKRLTQNFKKLLNDEDFIKSFTYHNVPIFSILKPTLEYLFIKRGKILEMIANIELSQKVLDQTKPKLVLVVEEDNLPSRALIKLSQLKHIPTMLMQHGFISKYSAKIPLLSDKILVWGKSFKKSLIKYNPHKRKDVFVTGRLSKDNLDRESIIKKLNIPPNKKIITLATNLSSEKDLILETLKTIKKLNNVQLVIKLHPMEDGKLPQKLAKLTNTNPIIIKDIDVDELINISDLVVVSLSTVGLIALQHKKPLIVVDLIGLADEMNYVKSGAALGIYDLKDLEENIKNALQNEKIKEKLRKKAEIYTKNHVEFNGKEALERTKQFISQLLN